MAFNLGPTDFQSFRDETTNYQKFIDAQNLRNAARDKGAGVRLPGVPQLPDNRPSGLPVTQRGPTPADVAAAQAEAARKAAAAEAARKAAAQPQAPAAALPEPDSLAARGQKLENFDPNDGGGIFPGTASRVGQAGSDIVQLDPTSDSAALTMGKSFVGQTQFNTKLTNIRYKLSLVGTKDSPATGALAQIGGFFTDNATERKAREEAGRITDWYDSNEALQFFRQNPRLLEMAEQDPIGVYRELRGRGSAPVPTKLPGGGVSLPFDPKTFQVTPLPTDPAASAAPGTLPPGLLDAVIQAESNGNPNAISPKGAKGILQVLDSTNKDPGFGVAPAKDNSPEERARVGEDYLGAMIKHYGGNIPNALAAYNWGPGNVDDWIAAGSDPAKLPKETSNYISQVQAALSTPVSAPTVVPPATKTAATKQIFVNNRNRPLTVKRAGVSEGPTPTSEQLLTKPPTKVTEPPKKMSFVLRSSEIMVAMNQLKSLRSRADLLSRAGNYQELLTTMESVNAHTVAVENMITKQALDTFEISKNPRMLNRILSQQNGRDISIAPNSDGTWNVSVDGVLTIESIATKAILNQQTRQLSSLYHAGMKAATAKAAAAARDAQIKFAFDHALQVTKSNTELMKARLTAAEFGTGGEGETLYHDGSGNIFKLGEIMGTHGELVYAMVPVPRNSATAGTPKDHKRS